jgi:signal peptidase I
VDPEPSEPAETHDPGAEAQPAAEPAAARRSGRNALVEIAQTLLLTLVIFFVIQNFVAQPFKVEGRSMEMTFVEGDFVLVDRLTPRWSPYDRGQVVVLRSPLDWSENGEPFIKRVIGIAGDTVEVRDDGAVAVNGAVLDEPYLFRDATGAVESTFADDGASWVVGSGELFVMGDHRQASMDSRVFGPIAVDSVIGRGVVRYWPVEDIGIVESATHDNVPDP